MPDTEGMATQKTLIDSEKLALPAKDAAALLGISRAQLWKLHSGQATPSRLPRNQGPPLACR